MCLVTHYFSLRFQSMSSKGNLDFKTGTTRMHSSRMLTTRLLPVCPSMHCSGGYLPGWVYLPRTAPGVCTCRGCTCQGRGVPVGGCTCQGVPAQGAGVLIINEKDDCCTNLHCTCFFVMTQARLFMVSLCGGQLGLRTCKE